MGIHFSVGVAKNKKKSKSVAPFHCIAIFGTVTQVQNLLPLLWFHMGNYYTTKKKTTENQFILKIWAFFSIHHRHDNNKTHWFKCSKCFVVESNFSLPFSFRIWFCSFVLVWKRFFWMELPLLCKWCLLCCALSCIHPFEGRSAKNKKLIKQFKQIISR